MSDDSKREALLLSPGLEERLVLLRRRQKLTHDPVLDAAAIEAIEKLKGVSLPADVLGYVAALTDTSNRETSNPLYEAVQGLEDEIDGFYAAADPPQPQWRRRSKFDHVVFDAWGDWPRFYTAYACGPADGKPFAVFDLKAMAFTSRFESLMELLDRRWGAPPTDANAEELAAFAPAILRRHPVERAERTVVHKKFGRGVVLREVDGKLQIDFGANGIRLLASSFVESVD